MSGELGAGISALWIVSAEPSSTRRVRSVKTERIRRTTIIRTNMRKMVRGRRMTVAVLGRVGEVVSWSRVRMQWSRGVVGCRGEVVRSDWERDVNLAGH